MSILFRNVYLLDGTMERARHADLFVEGENIKKIAASGSMSGENCDVIDGRGEMLLMPGFFNAHCHAAMTLLRGLGEERPLMEWLEQKIWPLEEHMTDAVVYAGAVQAMCEMAKCGVTGFTDMYYHMGQTARAVNELGMRCSVSVGVVRDPARFKKSLYRDFSEMQGPRIINCIDPHAPYTVPFEFVCECAEEAKNKDLPLQMHFLEADWERSYFTGTLKMTPVEYLERTGLAAVPRLVLVHGVQFKEDELEYLGSHDNITVVHCPASNLKLGSGIAPLPEMLEHGVHVALGTDGAASNNRLDLWGEMRLALLIHKGAKRDPLAVSSRQMIDCATCQGARAFGYEKVGRLAEGWAADLTAVDLTALHYLGADEENMGSYVAYAGDSGDVKHVLCGGSWLVRDRTFMPRLEKEIRAASLKQRAWLLAAHA